MKTTLYVLGAFLELVGIACLAAPDLVPGARRFSRWAPPRWRRFENRLRRLVGLRPRGIIHEAAGAGELNFAGSLDAIKGVPSGSLEEQVAVLVQRDQERQQREAEFGRRIGAIERESPERLAELRAEMESHMGATVAAAAAEYRFLRVLGALALTLGLAFSTWGNLTG